MQTPELNARATKEQQARYLADAWEEKIGDYVNKFEPDQVTVADIFTDVLNIKNLADWDQIKQNRAEETAVSAGRAV
jgi:hypothetical protein